MLHMSTSFPSWPSLSSAMESGRPKPGDLDYESPFSQSRLLRSGALILILPNQPPTKSLKPGQKSHHLRSSSPSCSPTLINPAHTAAPP